ncbi:FkbM family methyltransferase [Nafulsella turpanensis]|uniref:FkbM family methyltransferase n=1 Tax=Nafulsella turpanensis TaxID=1265690 RepID=UPI00034A5D40|nr:FkbM family methyltransferase [Nafulsella turpanensis]
MSFSLAKKVQRYIGLLREVRNWPSYLLFKARSSQDEDDFTFKFRNTSRLLVARRMLPPFKEVFFDQVYLQGIPQEFFQKEDLTIIDIGANVGFFSLFMLFRHPKARVYAFEPMPYNFNKLAQYKEETKLDKLFPINKAVAGTAEKLSLNYAGNGSFTTMASIFSNQRKDQILEVDATTLHQIAEEQQLSSIDFIKLDCEGAEYTILYNTPPSLFKKIKAMGIETHPGQDARENADALAVFLQEQGYQIKIKKGRRTGYIWAWRARE